MIFERWAAGLADWYAPTLVDLWQLSADRECERDRPPVVVVSPNG
jgi:hypothetical protein